MNDGEGPKESTLISSEPALEYSQMCDSRVMLIGCKIDVGTRLVKPSLKVARLCSNAANCTYYMVVSMDGSGQFSNGRLTDERNGT